MPALELEGQPLMVNTQAVEDRRMQVVDMDGVVGDVVAVIVRFAECDSGLMPPPANHIVKQRGWWSRP